MRLGVGDIFLCKVESIKEERFDASLPCVNARHKANHLVPTVSSGKIISCTTRRGSTWANSTWFTDCSELARPARTQVIAQSQIADSNSINAVSLSSVQTMKRFPSPRCASTIQIVRPPQSTAETQPQLQPALLRLSAIISQYFICAEQPG